MDADGAYYLQAKMGGQAMSEMFCFQCQQTAGGSGCVRTGVCGKQPETANLQDSLVCRLIRLAELCEEQNQHPKEVTRLLADGLALPPGKIPAGSGRGRRIQSPCAPHCCSD